jgi:hypothetical protein
MNNQSTRKETSIRKQVYLCIVVVIAKDGFDYFFFNEKKVTETKSKMATSKN